MTTTELDPNAELIERRKQAGHVSGATERKRHERGQLLARERVEKLVDPDSFLELDRYAQHRVLLELVERFGQALRQYIDAGLLELLGRPFVEILVDRIARRELLGPPED